MRRQPTIGAASTTATEPRGGQIVQVVGARQHTRNAGYPGTANAAVMEALDRNLVPHMFARVSLGKATAEESIAMTAWELKWI
jgi:hypothetical protein